MALPTIPKDYYPAVMFACKMLRKDGHFNRAVKIASNYYKVDEEKVAEYIKERKQATKNKPNQGKKLMWFVVERTIENFGESRKEYSIHKAYSSEALIKRLNNKDYWETYRNDTGSGYSSLMFYSKIVDMCRTEAEAVEIIKEGI